MEFKINIKKKYIHSKEDFIKYLKENNKDLDPDKQD